MKHSIYVAIINDEKHSVMVPTDFITGEWQKRRELRTGESFSFHINPDKIQEFTDWGLICAAVRDDIDRVCRSTEEELQTALKVLFK